MDVIVEYTIFIQDELAKIRKGNNNGFNANNVVELAKEIVRQAKRIRGQNKAQPVRKLVMGATGVVNVTKEFKKTGMFWDPEYIRMVYSFLKMMTSAEKELVR